MSQPIAYVPAYNFTSFQAANPSTPLPADKLDTELAALKITTDSVRANMAALQADDGSLRAAVVTPASLSPATAAMLVSSGRTIRGQWAGPGTAYSVGDVAAHVTGTFICVAAHVSTASFTTDYLTSGRWIIIAGQFSLASFDDLANVFISGLADSDIVYWNNSAGYWENSKLTNAMVTDGVLTFAKMASSFSITSTSLASASNSNVPTTTAIKTYVDNQISRGTGSPVASATATSLSGTGFDFAHITGTTTISAITLATDEMCWVVFDGILTLTHNATSLVLPGGANIATAAGDRALFRGIDGTNVECLTYVRASGQSVVASSKVQTFQVTDASDVSLSTAPTQANVGTAFAVTIPTKGVIKLTGTGQVTQSGGSGGVYVTFGIRIGSTNYWPTSVSGAGTQYATMFNSASNTNVTAVKGGGAAMYTSGSGATQTENASEVWLGIEAAGIPTGAQTVQIIAAKMANTLTLKGTVATTIVNISVIDHT